MVAAFCNLLVLRSSSNRSRFMIEQPKTCGSRFQLWLASPFARRRRRRAPRTPRRPCEENDSSRVFSKMSRRAASVFLRKGKALDVWLALPRKVFPGRLPADLHGAGFFVLWIFSILPVRACLLQCFCPPRQKRALRLAFALA